MSAGFLVNAVLFIAALDGCEGPVTVLKLFFVELGLQKKLGGVNFSFFMLHESRGTHQKHESELRKMPCYPKSL